MQNKPKNIIVDHTDTSLEIQVSIQNISYTSSIQFTDTGAGVTVGMNPFNLSNT